MIRIFKENIEIDIVKETLTIKKDNVFLDNDFKIQTNNFPFLIVENDNTRLTLGSNNITSINKNTYHDVKVETPEGLFEGELRIIAYLKNFRKCDLRFYSPIYLIKDRPINEFMPEKISTINGPTPIGLKYEEKMDELLPPQYMNQWGVYGSNIANKGYPEVMFNLPTYYYPNKFGENLKEGDDWYRYKGVVNNYILDNGIRYADSNNYYYQNGIKFHNATVNAPKVYLLSPLKRAVESVGYKLIGSFVESDFIKHIVLDSENDNLTEVNLNTEISSLPYPIGQWFNLPPFNRVKVLNSTLTVGKRYKIEIELKKVLNVDVRSYIQINGLDGPMTAELFTNAPYNELSTFSVEFNVPATGGPNANMGLVFIAQNSLSTEPLQVNYIKLYEVSEGKGYITHPIINLQRFVPDWSFVEYINELKKLFNLKITPNDHEKTLQIDFFNHKFIEKTGVNLNSILIESPETLEFDTLMIKYDNEEDDNVFVTKQGVLVGLNQIKDHTKLVESKFKFLPVKPNGLVMTKNIEDRGGIGLMIFLHNRNSTNPVPDFNGYSLNLANIYAKEYELPFTNYLYSSLFSAKGFLSAKEVKEISIQDFVIIDNRRYYVNSMEYKETPIGNYEVKLDLLLMVY